MRTLSLTLAALTGVIVVTGSATAQRAGQTATIRHGIVVGLQRVDLKTSNAAKGALVGGAFGAAVTSKSSRSSSTKWRNAAIGSAIGARAAASRRQTGRRYSVRINEGTVVQIVTDQTEILMGDCVLIEEAGGKANIRRVAATLCEPESEAVLKNSAIQEELQEEAAECGAAKEELGEAESDEQIDRAIRKIKILCYG